MRRNHVLLCLPLLLSLPAAAQAPQACAKTIVELRRLLGDPAFPLKWEETGMDDGKPLVVSMREHDGALFLEFVKTQEGLWAESAGVVCAAGADFETRFTAEQIRLGPAAGWALRYALGGGGKFTLTQLGADRLRIAASGWSGTFSPRTK